MVGAANGSSAGAGARVEGLEVLERARERGARLLSVEKLPAQGNASSEGVGGAFLLVFEVGRILVTARPAARSIHLMAIEDVADVPGGLEPAAEEEPWWRLLGRPLTQAGAEGANGALSLRFGAESEAPRRVRILREGEALHAWLERDDDAPASSRRTADSDEESR